jgi:hypothetical protein
MRAVVVLALLLLGPVHSHAGPLYDTFREGILGIPWHATLDQVISVYPDGDNVFATTSGHRSYWVKDGATFLGVPRDRQGIQYGFDAQNRLGIVTIGYAYERKEELRSALTVLFGAPTKIRDARFSKITRYVWTDDHGMHAHIIELGEAQKSIVWLVVASPGYEDPPQNGCPSARR